MRRSAGARRGNHQGLFFAQCISQEAEGSHFGCGVHPDFLAAEGKSTINNIGQIERGYERIHERLSALGASIRRVEDGKA